MTELRIALDDVRIRILGQREQRDSNEIWYEKQPRAKAVKDGQHCYGFSNMVEQPRRSEGPPATMKITNNELDEVQILVRDALKVRHTLFSSHTYL